MLTPEIVFSLRKPSYDVPDRLKQMLLRLNVTAIVKKPHGHGKPRGDWNNWRATALPKIPVKESTPIEAVMVILNKLSQANFEIQKKELAALLEKNPDDVLLSHKMAEAIYLQAIMGAIYANLFAKLVKELDNQLLLNLIGQKYREFSESFSKPIPNIDLNNQHLEIEDATMREAAKQADYDAFCALNKEKKKRRGFAHWIAELSMAGILTQRDVRLVVANLFKMLNDDIHNSSLQEQVHEYVECIYTVCKTVKGTKLQQEILENCKSIYAIPRTETPGLTMRTRFKIQDILEGK